MNTIRNPIGGHSDQYEQCPFCDRIFVEGIILRNRVTGETSGNDLEEHISTEHNKVKVRKGTNYKWMDLEEVKRLIKK